MLARATYTYIYKLDIFDSLTMQFFVPYWNINPSQLLLITRKLFEILK